MSETPGSERVDNLLKLVDDGSLVIPYFQRGYEWQAGMVCDLFESILQDYYTGLLLLWNLNEDEAEKEKWDPVWGAELSGQPKHAILDGQQRLSSLYFAAFNPKEKFPYRGSYYLFYLNLNDILNDEFDDAVTYKYYKRHQKWAHIVKEKDAWAETGIVPLAILSAKDQNSPSKNYIGSKEFESWITKYIDQNKNKLPEDITTHTVYKVFDSILGYTFVTYPLGSHRSLHDICNIFAKVNAKGMKLTTFDLMNAFLYPKGVELRKKLWEGLNNDLLKGIDSSMNEYLLKIISLVKQNYCSSKYIYNLIPGQKTARKDFSGEKYEEILVEDGREFISLWNDAYRYAEKAREIIMNTGTDDFGAIKQDFIPNTTILPVIAAILWIYDGDMNEAAFISNWKKWYWTAVLTEDYSGSVDTVMSKDFRDWKEWFKSKKTIERINLLNKDFINALDLKTVKKGSARYNAILCLLSLNDIQDFHKGRIVGTGSFKGSSINDHHIFPNKVKGIDPQKSKTFSASKDMIVNRTLLFDETNNKIKSNRPSQYIADMVKINRGDTKKVKKILSKHLINDAAFDCMKQDDFDGFIDAREQAIKEHIIKTLEL